MHAMKTLTFGVGVAALASAIGFIYAQATSEGPPLVPRFGYTTRQALARPPMDISPRTGDATLPMDSSSIPTTDSGAPTQGNTDPLPGDR